MTRAISFTHSTDITGTWCNMDRRYLMVLRVISTPSITSDEVMQCVTGIADYPNAYLLRSTP